MLIEADEEGEAAIYEIVDAYIKEAGQAAIPAVLKIYEGLDRAEYIKKDMELEQLR